MKMELVTVECATCYMPFGMTKTTQDRLRKCHNAFYCPSGHVNYYSGETQEEKLRKQLLESKEYADRLVKEKHELQKEVLALGAKKKPFKKSKTKKSIKG